MHESGSEQTACTSPANQTENGDSAEKDDCLSAQPLTPEGSGADSQQQNQVPVSVSMMTPPVETPQQTLKQQQVLNPQQIQALLQQQKALMLHQQHIQDLCQKQQDQFNAQLLQQKHAEKSGQEQLAAQHMAIQQQLLQVQQQHLLSLQRQGLLSVLPSMSPSAAQGLMKGCENGTRLLSGGENPATLQKNLLHSQQSSTNGNHSSQILKKKDSGPVDNHTQNTHPLYGHGMCKWSGCEAVFGDFQVFLKHLNSEHTLDDKSTAQCRVQMQVVQQLELQLKKDKERLQAMMSHLKSSEQKSKPATPTGNLVPNVSFSQVTFPKVLPSMSLSQSATAPSTPLTPPPTTSSILPPHTLLTVSSGRRWYSDSKTMKYSKTMNQDIVQNKEARPPFTYAALIRQAIFESPYKQLTLNEIYNWFTRTFAYFRRNAATWKNAVRHNLSLHKCFVRVENVKGAVWTVDEMEFQRRRPQKPSGEGSLKRENTDHGHSSAFLTPKQEEMNAALWYGNGSYSDSSEEQYPMHPLVKEELMDEEAYENVPHDCSETESSDEHSSDVDQDGGSPERPNLQLAHVPSQ
ncbi:forkhead box protein P1-B-like isoform X1 [Salvelinus fontinalis]|uniref:forkhead box protein P1-B-like isoform X1 n=2 Tax=Salvelinus fontinalis TaxID=8038 RepID=UPI00248667B3|nr:forkhead box protein P1-B-like isoform X1 [Salvelinus fontinalis]XP_055748093.1 forkhead box protein P1-B-like isoform X1 [Salvelinus fontinalis]XP_055748094.1 forkhead box protein P1-B-like isoform X1 [Salvelinus fontinalis]